MKTKKGLELPVSMIIVVAIAVLVIAAVAFFFLSTGGSQINTANAETVFTTKCQLYCNQQDPAANRQLVTRLVTLKDPGFQQFLDACTTKGIPWKDSKGEAPLLCLAACPCNVAATPSQTSTASSCRATCTQKYSSYDDVSRCLNGCIAG